MLLLALTALLQVGTPATMDSSVRVPLDSIAPRRAPGYSSAALAALVGEASVRNRRVPPALEGYPARVESEIALVLKRAEGQEVTASL